MSKQVNIHQAKTHFSRLLAEVQTGEEIIIAKAGIPVARLTSAVKRRSLRKPGSAKGRVTILSNFNAPLPSDVIDAFER